LQLGKETKLVTKKQEKHPREEYKKKKGIKKQKAIRGNPGATVREKWSQRDLEKAQV